MRFRAGFLLGAGVGYVLGARAGRERYEQIKQLYLDLRRHPAVEQVVGQATGVSDLVRSGVANGLSAGSKGLRAVGDKDRTA